MLLTPLLRCDHPFSCLFNENAINLHDCIEPDRPVCAERPARRSDTAGTDHRRRSADTGTPGVDTRAGRVLLLKIPPNDKGLIVGPDVKRLRKFKAALDQIFSKDLAQGAAVAANNIRGGADAYEAANVLDGDLDSYWATDDGQTTGALEFDLGQPSHLRVRAAPQPVGIGVIGIIGGGKAGGRFKCPYEPDAVRRRQGSG